MAVISTDIKARLSGGASNNLPGASLGGVRSSVDMSSTALNNLFDNVSAAEATAGRVEYRCIYIVNANSTDTLNAVKVFMGSATPSTSTKLEIGLDPAGIGNGADTGVATVIASETDAPAGVTFTEPLNEAAALIVGNLAAGQGIAVWAKRTVTAGAPATTNDGTTFEVRGTPA